MRPWPKILTVYPTPTLTLTFLRVTWNYGPPPSKSSPAFASFFFCLTRKINSPDRKKDKYSDKYLTYLRILHKFSDSATSTRFFRTAQDITLTAHPLYIFYAAYWLTLLLLVSQEFWMSLLKILELDTQFTPYKSSQLDSCICFCSGCRDQSCHKISHLLISNTELACQHVFFISLKQSCIANSAVNM